jgi:transcriptional regulator with XRE-family HTH domain
MEGFGERLRGLMSRQRISYHAMGDVVGVSGQAVHKWVKGGGISPEHVKTIANYFKVSPAFLFFGEENALPVHEIEILFKFRKMDEEARKSVLDYIEFKAAQCEKRLQIGEPKVAEPIK